MLNYYDWWEIKGIHDVTRVVDFDYIVATEVVKYASSNLGCDFGSVDPITGLGYFEFKANIAETERKTRLEQLRKELEPLGFLMNGESWQ